MYNDTIYNTPQGSCRRQISESIDDTTGESPMQLILLNNTFYNDPSRDPDRSPRSSTARTRSRTSTCWRWTTSSTGRRTSPSTFEGQAALSTLEYNLFFNNTTQRRSPRPHDGDFPGNAGADLRRSQVRRPGHTELRARSRTRRRSTRPAAKSAPSPGRHDLPTVNQLLSNVYGIRTDPTTLPSRNSLGLTTSSAASATSRTHARSSPCRDQELQLPG